MVSPPWRCTPTWTGTPARDGTPTRPTPWAGRRPETLPQHRHDPGRRRRSGADSCIPVTGSSRRTPTSPVPRSRRGCQLIGPPAPAIRDLATRCRPATSPRVRAPRSSRYDRVRRAGADEVEAFATEFGLAHRDQGGVRWWRSWPEGRPFDRSRDPRAVTTRRRPGQGPEAAFGRGGSASWRSTSTAPGTSRPRSWPTSTATSWSCPRATARCNAVTRSSWRRRPRRFLTDEQVERLYSSSKAIVREAGYYGAGTVRVPRRQGRDDLVPRGQHPPAGGAPGHRGGLGDRPRARAVPHRRRRGARLQRPTVARALHRVPHQRRGSWPRLPALRPGP